VSITRKKKTSKEGKIKIKISLLTLSTKAYTRFLVHALHQFLHYTKRTAKRKTQVKKIWLNQYRFRAIPNRDIVKPNSVLRSIKMGTNSLSSESITDLDQQIEQLMQCKPLSEPQVLLNSISAWFRKNWIEFPNLTVDNLV